MERLTGLEFDTQYFGKRLFVLEETDSTNNEVKRQAETGAEQGLVVVAKRQNAGRGRLGRSWSSPNESGLWMSFLLKTDIKPESASMLTIVAAMAAQQAIESVTGLKALIKWPNDIVVNKKKICGILTEMATEGMKVKYVVVGVGINVNTDEFPEEIKEMASSLKMESGKEVSKDDLLVSFGQYFERYYAKFISCGNLSLIMDEYNKCLANRDREVKIIDDGEERVGVAVGINEIGELLVKNSEGDVQVVRSGEVSVRGLYGYV